MIEEYYDVAVVGAGHAGCEAALACARLGLNTIVFTVSVNSIALMPCNPSVGGSSKGHLVRELDALGGEMGKNIDKTFIQSKMLNRSKGPAVHSLRAQADKAEYTKSMRQVLENQENLTIKQAEVSELILNDKNEVTGVKIYTGIIYNAKAVVLCTGTYLRARCLCGEAISYTGPNGLQAANHLTESLEKAGIELLSGQDLITQSELDDVDKALAASSLVLSGGAKLAGKLASESAKGAKILRKAETFTKEANDVCGTVSDFKRFNELYDQ